MAADATIGRRQATPPAAVPEPWCELEPVTATGGDPTGGYGTSLVPRAAFADARGVDALISIHHNAHTTTLGDLPGTEV